MKFDHSEFWKHENCVDVFFKPTSIAFDDNNRHAILHGSWMTQAVEWYWFTPVQKARLFIDDSQYKRWKPYTPKGRLKL